MNIFTLPVFHHLCQSSLRENMKVVLYFVTTHYFLIVEFTKCAVLSVFGTAKEALRLQPDKKGLLEYVYMKNMITKHTYHFTSLNLASTSIL